MTDASKKLLITFLNDMDIIYDNRKGTVILHSPFFILYVNLLYDFIDLFYFQIYVLNIGIYVITAKSAYAGYG